MPLVYPHKWLNFKSLFIAISLCFISAPSYGEGWYPLAKGEDSVYFVQIIAPNQDNPYPKAWWWIIWRDKREDPDGIKWDNYKDLYELDCKNHRTRILHRAFYDEEELITDFPVKEDWEPILPDSSGDYFMRFVCDQSEYSLRSLSKPIEIDIKTELSFLRDKSSQQAIKEKIKNGQWFIVYAINYKDSKFIIFHDKTSLRIKGSYRQILSWSLRTNPLSEQPLAIAKSEGCIKEFDCDKQRYRYLKIFQLNKNGQIFAQALATEWKPIRKNTLRYDELCMVCQNKFKSTPITVDFSTIKTIPDEWLVGSDE